MAFFQSLGETLLGEAPRTDTPGMFIGDIVHGLGDPNGILGQFGRILATMGAYGSSPGAGMAMEEKFRKSDARDRALLEQGAANKYSPQEIEARYGIRVPHNIALMPVDESPRTAQDMALGTPNKGSMSIDFPVSPEAQFKQKIAELQNARANYNFGATPESGEQAQRMYAAGVRPSGEENTQMAAKYFAEQGGYDPARESLQTTIGPHGVQRQISERSPMHNLFTASQLDAMHLAPGMEKNVIPANIQNDAGEQLYTLELSHAQHELRDPQQQLWEFTRDQAIKQLEQEKPGGYTPEDLMGKIREFSSQGTKPVKEEKDPVLRAIHGLQDRFKSAGVSPEAAQLSPDEEFELRQIYKEKPPKPMDEEFARAAGKPLVSPQEKLDAFTEKVYKKRVAVAEETAKLPDKKPFAPDQDYPKVVGDVLQLKRAGQSDKAVRALSLFLSRQEGMNTKQKLDYASRVLADAGLQNALPQVAESLGVSPPGGSGQLLKEGLF